MVNIHTKLYISGKSVESAAQYVDWTYNLKSFEVEETYFVLLAKFQFIN